MCSSRAVCAQFVLINTGMFDYIDTKHSPYVQHLGSWVDSHTEKDMLIKIDVQTAKEWRITCYKCYGFGHKGSECVYTTTKARLLCAIPGCGKQHHPRDCFKNRKQQDSAETGNKPTETSHPPKESTEKNQAPGTAPKPAASSGRSEQVKKNLDASRAMKKAARQFDKGEKQEEEAENVEGEVTGDDGNAASGWSDSGVPWDHNAPGDNPGEKTEDKAFGGNGDEKPDWYKPGGDAGGSSGW